MAGIVGHMDISPPGQCQVMFCIATEHNGGTQHYDGTGASFVSCTHGNLSQWDPCGHCGFGTDDFPDKAGEILDALTRQYRALVDLRARHVEALGENNVHVTFTDMQLQTYRYAIGAAVSVRLGRDLSGDHVAANALRTIAAGKTYVESVPAE